jgi:branched-chain amino acid transport system substrate-binding protein
MTLTSVHRSRHRSQRLLAVGFGLLLLVTGCGKAGSSSSGAGTNTATVKVGTVLPLSGSAAAIAGQYLAGITAAIEAANAKGGVNGHKIELVKVDDGFEVPRTIAGIRELAQKDRVAGIIGPYGTNAGAATIPITDSVKVPLVGPLAYAEALYDPVHPYMFPLWPSQTSIYKALTDYAITKLGAKRIAVVANDGTVGNETIAGTKAAAAAHGLNVVTELRSPNAQADYSGVMGQVARATPDVVVLQSDTATMAKVLADAHRAGLHVPFFGGVSAGDAGMPKLAGADANNSYGSVNIDLTGSAPGWSDYTGAMKEHTKADPTTSFAASGYSAAQVMLGAISKVSSAVTPEKVAKALEGNKFQTLAGPVTFTKDNHLGVKTLLLTVVKDQKVTLTGDKLTAS